MNQKRNIRFATTKERVKAEIFEAADPEMSETLFFTICFSLKESQQRLVERNTGDWKSREKENSVFVDDNFCNSRRCRFPNGQAIARENN